MSALGQAGPGKEGASSQASKLLHVAQDFSMCQHVHSSPITAGAELGISCWGQPWCSSPLMAPPSALGEEKIRRDSFWARGTQTASLLEDKCGAAAALKSKVAELSHG